jgi:hypothetical protein
VLNADTVTVVTTEDSDQRLPDDDQSQAVYESEPEVKQQTSEKELQELNQKAEQIRQLVLRSDFDACFHFKSVFTSISSLRSV